MTTWAVVAVLAVTPAAAQRPRPITWCEHPSREPKWSTEDISVGIAQRTSDGDSTSIAHRLGTPVLGLILQTVAARIQRIAGFSEVANGRLPAADHRYTPAVVRTEVAFTLLGDGTLATVSVGPHSDTLFASDLITALRESAEARELVIDGDRTSRFDVELFVVDHIRRGNAQWRAFTMFVPRALPALVDRQRPAVRYPDSATRWEANFVLHFVVGWNGKARRETMRTVPAIDAYRWPSPKERKVFEAFIRHVKYAVAKWEFLPAEIAGCRVDQLVQQNFTFSTK